MKLAKEVRQKNSIVSYTDKQIVLKDATIDIPCFLAKDYHTKVNINQLADINVNNIKPLVEKTKINILIIGTGNKQKFLSPKQQYLLYELKIAVDVMSNPSACRLYNLLLSDFREVALLIL